MSFLNKICAAAVLAVCSIPAVAQTSSPFPRAHDGHPDFQGTWASRWITPLERMRGAQAVSVDADTAEKLIAAYFDGLGRRPGNANPDSDFDLEGLVPVDGAYRTSLVTIPDTGLVPFSKPAQARLDAFFNVEGLDNPEERDVSERCIAGGGRAPMLTPPSNGYIQIVQTDDYLVLLSEGLNDIRVLSADHPGSNAVRGSFQGVSTARWEGDVYVVRTTDFRTDDVFRIAPPFGVAMLSPKSVVLERFTPISKNEFRYSFSVTDDTLYTQSWTAETTYVRTEAKLFEYACHEANYSMTNMLQGGRKLDALKIKK